MDHKRERLARVVKDKLDAQVLEEVFSLLLDTVREEREMCAHYCDNAALLYEKNTQVKRCAEMIGKAIRERG